jgi:hypothetical protein
MIKTIMIALAIIVMLALLVLFLWYLSLKQPALRSITSEKHGEQHIYEITTVDKGVQYTVNFFGSFSGHFQPFMPKYPLTIDEAVSVSEKYNRSVTYQGWYSESKTGPRLDRFIKYRLLGEEYREDFISSTKPGAYYHRLKKEGEKWVVGTAIAPESLVLQLHQLHYLRYVVNNEQKIVAAHHIYSMLMDSYIYTYNSSGVLINTEDSAYEVASEIPDL